MLKVFYGNNEEATYNEVSKIKKSYDYAVVCNDYFEIGEIFTEISDRVLFRPKNRLLVLYSLDTNYYWVLDVIKESTIDLVLVFDKFDKRSKVAKAITKQVKPVEYKIVNENIFSYIDHIMSGNLRYILENLEAFEIEYQAIEKLIALLFRHCFIILRVKRMRDKGYNDSDIADYIKVNKYFIRKHVVESSKKSYDQILGDIKFLKWTKEQLSKKYKGESSISEKTLISAILLHFSGGE